MPAFRRRSSPDRIPEQSAHPSAVQRGDAASARLRIKAALWRFRHLLIATALLAFVLILANAMRPPPDGVLSVVLSQEVTAGHVLTPDDVTRLHLPPTVAAATVREVSDAVGKAVVVDLPKGTAVSEALLAGPSLIERAPEGSVVIPIVLADEGSRVMAEVGSIVTLLGATNESNGAILAADVVVLSRIDSESNSSLLGIENQITTLLVAVPAKHASVVIEASAIAPLRLALFPLEKGITQ